MKKILFKVACCFLLGVTELHAQTDDEMKAWQNYMTPGEPHQMLAKASGEWTQEITMWMDPGTAPTKTTTTAIYEMIMGGRYQVSKTTGDMMGMPFEGMSITGYDNSKKLYSTTWIDNFGTGIMLLEGPWDEANKTIDMKGKGLDPTTGKEILMRQVIKFIGNDTQEIAMYDNKNGTEVKMMEIKSTRKK